MQKIVKYHDNGSDITYCDEITLTGKFRHFKVKNSHHRSYAIGIHNNHEFLKIGNNEWIAAEDARKEDAQTSIWDSEYPAP